MSGPTREQQERIRELEINIAAWIDVQKQYTEDRERNYCQQQIDAARKQIRELEQQD